MLNSEIEKKLEEMEKDFEESKPLDSEPPDGNYIVKIHSLSFKDGKSDKMGDYLRLTFRLEIAEGDFTGRNIFKSYNIIPSTFSWLKRDLKTMDMEMGLKELYTSAITFIGIVLKVQKKTKKDSQYSDIYILERLTNDQVPPNRLDDLPFQELT